MEMYTGADLLNRTSSCSVPLTNKALPNELHAIMPGTFKKSDRQPPSGPRLKAVIGHQTIGFCGSEAVLCG
jgi:hypothetical protein